MVEGEGIVEKNHIYLKNKKCWCPIWNSKYKVEMADCNFISHFKSRKTVINFQMSDPRSVEECQELTGTTPWMVRSLDTASFPI